MNANPVHAPGPRSPARWLRTGDVSSAECAELKERLGWAALDDVKTVARLPVDRRHNAKIDYPALQEMLPHQGD